MRVRLASLAMGAIAAATLAVSFAAPDAFASAQHPAAHATHHVARRLPSGNWCLTNSPAPGACMIGQGAGNQIQLTNSPGSYMHVSAVASGTFEGLPEYEYQNNNGNCVREGTGGIVKLQNGGCTGAADNWWINESGGHKDNQAYLNIMYTNGTATGDNVFAGSGAWENFTIG